MLKITNALFLTLILMAGCAPRTPGTVIPTDQANTQNIASLPLAASSDSNYTSFKPIDGKNIKNIILVILDGTGLNHILATRYQYYGLNGRLNMERFPDVALVNTHSADSSIITDSGAAATAMATGSKTSNGVLGMSADGIQLKNLVSLSQQKGKSTALITYGSLVGATPAAFATHTMSRKNNAIISQQLLSSGIDFLFGDAIGWQPDSMMHKYKVWNNRLPDTTDATTTTHLVLYDTLVKEQASIKQNQVVLQQGAPTLSDVLPIALHMLKKNSKGFFMMLEEDWTDSWAHEGKAALTTWHVKHADDALRPLIQFAREDGETLILVTADHETGGWTIPYMSASSQTFAIHFSTPEHSAAMVPLYALGPGAEEFHGVIDNTDIFKKLALLLQQHPSIHK